MIEGSGAGAVSVPLTNGSGSGRPKNLRILRLKIRNTAYNKSENLVLREASLQSKSFVKSGTEIRTFRFREIPPYQRISCDEYLFYVRQIIPFSRPFEQC